MPGEDGLPPPFARIDAMLHARRHAVTLLLILFAVTVRATFWSQVVQGPCGALHRWEQSDMHHFDGWGRAVAAGDLRSANVRVPINLSHQAIARAFLAANPADPAHAASNPARVLWDRWLGDGRFYQEPLYPYLVAAIYRTAPDHGPRAVAGFQMLLGVLTVLFVRRITDRRFGPSAGLLAGVAAVAAGPVLFYEALLLRESLIVFAGVVLVDAADRAVERGTTLSWAALGLLIGLAATLKGHFALFGLGMAAIAVVRTRHAPGRAAGLLLAFGGGWLVALAPMIARNLSMGVAPLATASGGGYTFLLANLPGADPAQGGAPGIAAHIEATRGRLLPSVIAAVGAWDTPLDWLGHVARKATVLLHWPEVPNNENLALFREYAPILGILPVSFAAVLPPAALGGLVARRRWKRDATLILMIAVNLATVLLFMPLARFRAPLVLLLLPFASFGVLWLAAGLMGRCRRFALLGLAGVALVAAFVWRPAPPGAGAVRPSDRAATLQAWTLPVAAAAADAGRWDLADFLYRDALVHAPGAMRDIADGRPARLGPWEIPLAGLYAEVWRGLALAAEAAGRTGEVATLRQAADRLDAAAARAPVRGP